MKGIRIGIRRRKKGKRESKGAHGYRQGGNYNNLVNLNGP